MDFLRVFYDFNNVAWNWITVFLFYGGFSYMLRWHWKVWRRIMETADKEVRGGIMLAFLIIATANLFTIMGWDSTWRRPALVVSGVLICVGFQRLMLKYEGDPIAGVLQTQQDISRQRLALSATLSNNNFQGANMATTTVTKTSQLTPDGIAGVSKAISGFVGLLGTVLVAIQPSFPPGSDWARWVGVGIAVCGAIGVYLVSNTFKPIQAHIPDPNVELPDGEPSVGGAIGELGKHEAPGA